MFKKILVILCLSFVLVVPGALARSGCCSSHGGVCGCECCDGKSLSAVCQQYYEGCENTGSAENERDDGWIVLLIVFVPIALVCVVYNKKKVV